VIVSAGTGKTATFAVAILQRLDIENKQCQALVLAPTRELALQIQKVIGALGDFMSVKIHACVGGTAVRDDIRTLQEGVHVVVGTPGRVYDMIQRRALKLDSVGVSDSTMRYDASRNTVLNYLHELSHDRSVLIISRHTDIPFTSAVRSR
jgi:ERCC4-related helicase